MLRLRSWSTDSARQLKRCRFKEGKVTRPGREARENVETLGDTVARMVIEALYDIKSRGSELPDT